MTDDHAKVQTRDPSISVALDGKVRAAQLGDARDRLEAAGAAFHERVSNGFRELAEANPATWVVADAAAGITEIAHVVADTVSSRLA